MINNLYENMWRATGACGVWLSTYVDARYMRLKYGIPTRVIGTCFFGEGGWNPINLRQFHSLLICIGAKQ